MLRFAKARFVDVDWVFLYPFPNPSHIPSSLSSSSSAEGDSDVGAVAQAAVWQGLHRDEDCRAKPGSQAALGILRMASALREVPKTELLLAERSRAVKTWTRSRP